MINYLNNEIMERDNLIYIQEEIEKAEFRNLLQIKEKKMTEDR